MNSFDQFVRLLADGDPVRAGTVNRPLRQIDQNAKYLWDVLQAAGTGSTVYARRQTLEAEAAVGMAVYLNAATQRFERALAAVEVDNTTGAVVTAASAQVWGVVAEKINATLADVLLYGVAKVDLSAAVSGPLVAGTYYLSSGSPGRLVAQRPPVGGPVLRRTPDGRVFVAPQFVDFVDRHVHYQFPLACRPAGGTHPPEPGDRHEITDPDGSARGWLPADDAAFGGKAPFWAEFGYNLAADPALAASWPPVPVGNAVLEWDKGLDPDVGMTRVPGGLVVLNSDGIWWLSSCYGDVPWPAGLDTYASASVSESASESSPQNCPRPTTMSMVLSFTRVNFATDSSVVLSLRSGDARVKIRCHGDPTKEAATGHLDLTLDLNLVTAEGVAGFQVLKGFDPETSEFSRGPATEGVYALSSNVSLAGSASSTRTVDGVARTVYQGLVGITVDPADTKELDVQLVRLDGAEEAWLGTPPVMYLEFLNGDEREYRGKIHVPYDLAIPDPVLSLRFQILGRAVGTLPQLTFSGRIVPRPDGPTALPSDGDEFSVNCVTNVALAAANRYVEASSDPFSVAAGDTVYFTVRRSASDGYAGAVGVLRHSGVVTSGT